MEREHQSSSALYAAHHLSKGRTADVSWSRNRCCVRLPPSSHDWRGKARIDRPIVHPIVPRGPSVPHPCGVRRCYLLWGQVRIMCPGGEGPGVVADEVGAVVCDAEVVDPLPVGDRCKA